MNKKTQSYKDLEIYLLSRELAVKIHKTTLEKLGAKLFNFREVVINGQ